MKNKLQDLNDHLFAQMERLGDEETSGEKLTAEIERSKAMTNVAAQIINNAKLVLDAQVKFSEGRLRATPKMIGITGEANADL